MSFEDGAVGDEDIPYLRRVLLLGQKFPGAGLIA
ncbi:MAG: hypothetical protein BWX83_01312 [Candidatus Cloacimonetes bacterium ADurb.Bin117]|nr:MAG: hypothetical protein BWX83_01312 [Candidatus Cloacimonetes bacterium ADurb.Bin117]